MFNIIDENKSSLVLRQETTKMQREDVFHSSSIQTEVWQVDIWDCGHCVRSAATTGSVPPVCCVYPDSCCICLALVCERRFFFFHSAWGTALRNADLFIVHLRWMGLHERCVPLNSTKAKHSQQPGCACLWQRRGYTDCSFLLASEGCTEKNLHCNLGVCPP